MANNSASYIRIKDNSKQQTMDVAWAIVSSSQFPLSYQLPWSYFNVRQVLRGRRGSLFSAHGRVFWSLGKETKIDLFCTQATLSGDLFQPPPSDHGPIDQLEDVGWCAMSAPEWLLSVAVIVSPNFSFPCSSSFLPQAGSGANTYSREGNLHRNVLFLYFFFLFPFQLHIMMPELYATNFFSFLCLYIASSESINIWNAQIVFFFNLWVLIFSS